MPAGWQLVVSFVSFVLFLFTLSRFCAERRAQGFQPLTGMGTHPW